MFHSGGISPHELREVLELAKQELGSVLLEKESLMRILMKGWETEIPALLIKSEVFEVEDHKNGVEMCRPVGLLECVESFIAHLHQQHRHSRF